MAENIRPEILEMIRQRRLNAIDPTRAARLKLQEIKDDADRDIDTTIDVDAPISDIGDDDIIEALSGDESDEGGLINTIVKIASEVGMNKLKFDQKDRIDEIERQRLVESLPVDDLSESITRKDILDSRDQVQLPPIPGFDLERDKKEQLASIKKALGLPSMTTQKPDNLDGVMGDIMRAGFRDDLSADALEADIVAGIGEQFMGRQPSYSLSKLGQFGGSSANTARQYLAAKIAERNQAVKNKINLSRLAIDSARIQQQAKAADDRISLGKERLKERVKNRMLKQQTGAYKIANSAIGDAINKLIVLDKNENFKRFNKSIPNAEQKFVDLIKFRDQNNQSIIDIINQSAGTQLKPLLPTDIMTREEIKEDE